jgi:hypothetical protein
MSDLGVILEKLEGLEQGIAALQEAMGMLLEAASPTPTHATPPAAPTPIASYEQMYGPIEAAPVAQTPTPPAPPAPPRPGRMRRWLTKEDGA